MIHEDIWRGTRQSDLPGEATGAGQSIRFAEALAGQSGRRRTAVRVGLAVLVLSPMVLALLLAALD